MNLGISGKIALVTAASKGLGRGAAEALSAEGCRVAICARTADSVNRAAEEISSKTGREVMGLTADMSRASDIEALFENVRAKLGDPDIVVCNAGGPPTGNFATTTVDQFHPAIELSMLSSIRMTYIAVPAMKAKGWGRIVFITSFAVKQPIPFLILSNTARAGLTGFMKTVAREIAATGVTVNAVLPGIHATDRVKDAIRWRADQEHLPYQEAVDAQKAMSPMHELGDPADFGGVVAFLCSRQAKFITGESLLVDGGAYAGLV